MSLEKINILLVGDHPGKPLTYEAILGELGENLIRANSRSEALELLLKTDIAIVLVDVCMPNLDGFELATLIRQHPRGQKTSIIFISAIPISNLDQLKRHECGAVDYFSAPIVPELLRARVMIFADLYRKTATLERMNLELEQRVAERIAAPEVDLAVRKQVEEALLDADRRKDEFLAVLAHELRNPLAPIRTAVDLMGLRKLEDPKLRMCRDVILRQVDHLSRLVDNLQDISRVASGRIKLQKKLLDVEAFVKHAIATNRPLFEARRQELSVSQPEQRLIVEGDLTRLAQAVGNLLDNATKYTGEGGHISLRVGKNACLEDPAREDVVISVMDTGAGISPEMLPKIFDLFTQAPHTQQIAPGGLGIGLALVRRLMDLHGGSVEARSDGTGKGSEFVLRLPLHSESDVPEQIGEGQPP